MAPIDEVLNDCEYTIHKIIGELKDVDRHPDPVFKRLESENIIRNSIHAKVTQVHEECQAESDDILHEFAQLIGEHLDEISNELEDLQGTHEIDTEHIEQRLSSIRTILEPYE